MTNELIATMKKSIVRIERGETSNSRSPMWRCVCSDSDRVNIFKHEDPARNSFALFDAAGYGALLMAMEVGAMMYWRTDSIEVTVERPIDSKWWNIVAVEPKPEGAQPDPAFTPSLPLYRSVVEYWASSLRDPSLPVVVLDTETTGLSFDDDEIVDLCVMDLWGGTLFNSLIQPGSAALTRMQQPGANGQSAAEITGISPESLSNAQNFIQAYPRIAEALNGKVWCIYNAAFDTVMLERMCARLHLRPFAPLAVVCVMENFATWHGNWDAQRQKFIPVKLAEACDLLGIEIQPHRAAADVKATIGLIHQLADFEDGDGDVD